MKNKKVFLIINSYYIGDILLVNPLIQNIKRIYKDSWVVMLTPPSMVDIAKYQEGVDDVIVWDRHGIHHGWYNMFKFVWNFPYKDIFASFPIYSADRTITLAWLLNSKYILGYPRNIVSIFLHSKYKIKKLFKGVQGSHVNLLSGLTKEKLYNFPVKFNIPNINTETLNKIKCFNDEFICLCPTSSKNIKDMPEEDICSIIENSKYKFVLLGKGKTAENLSRFLSRKRYVNLLDLTNKTSLLELAKIIDLSKACISVDTGSLHLSCALNKPAVGVFYNKQNLGFKPDSNIYTNTYCESDLGPTEIMNKVKELTKNKY